MSSELENIFDNRWTNNFKIIIRLVSKCQKTICQVSSFLKREKHRLEPAVIIYAVTENSRLLVSSGHLEIVITENRQVLTNNKQKISEITRNEAFRSPNHKTCFSFSFND